MAANMNGDCRSREASGTELEKQCRGLCPSGQPAGGGSKTISGAGRQSEVRHGLLTLQVETKGREFRRGWGEKAPSPPGPNRTCTVGCQGSLTPTGRPQAVWEACSFVKQHRSTPPHPSPQRGDIDTHSTKPGAQELLTATGLQWSLPSLAFGE